MEEPSLGTCVIGTSEEITAIFLLLPGMVVGLYQAHVPVRPQKAHGASTSRVLLLALLQKIVHVAIS